MKSGKRVLEFEENDQELSATPNRTDYVLCNKMQMIMLQVDGATPSMTDQIIPGENKREKASM